MAKKEKAALKSGQEADSQPKKWWLRFLQQECAGLGFPLFRLFCADPLAVFLRACVRNLLSFCKEPGTNTELVFHAAPDSATPDQ